MSELEKLDFSAAVERLRIMANNNPAMVAALAEQNTGVKETLDREARRRALGIPRRIDDVLSTPAQTQALEKINAWLADRTPADWCIVLGGAKGCGKSVAAGHALRVMAGDRGSLPGVWDAGRSTEKKLRLWWTASELASLGTRDGRLEALCEYAGPLVLDDLGTEHADVKGFFSHMLDQLADTRYREYSPLIVTTNLLPEAFTARYGERLIDRLREGGKFVFLGGSKSLRGLANSGANGQTDPAAQKVAADGTAQEEK